MAAAVNLSDELRLPNCPQCGASEYLKAGKNSNNKQPMLKCRNCGRSWTLDKSVDLSVVEKGLKNLRLSSENIIPQEVICKRCQSPNIRVAGWFRSKSGNTRRARCVDCKKYFPAPELNGVETLGVGHVTREDHDANACPKCKGTRLGSGGTNSNGKALAHCRTCNTRWVIYLAPKELLPELTCPSCAQKESFVKAGTENGVQKYRCQTCLTSFIPSTDWNPQCPDCGSYGYSRHGTIKVKVTEKQEPCFRCRDCNRVYSQHSQPKVSTDPYVIDVRQFGDGKEYFQAYKIRLDDIHPQWFRDVVLKYVKHRLLRGDLAFQTARNRVSAARHLGDFLEEFYPGIQPKEITRQLMLEVFSSSWWSSIGNSSKKIFLGFISRLFETMEQFGWEETSGERLIFQEDYPKGSKINARYIPESVMSQIMDSLHSLPLPFQRAILLLSETGMRFSELTILKKGCIQQDIGGYWWLTYYQAKMRKQHRIPISKECAFLVQEQEKFVEELFGTDFDYVFCGRSTQIHVWRPKPMKLYGFNKAIQRWATDEGITGPNGKIWHLTSHQFRHTVATRMINAGVAQHYVQQYLGHETSQMTQHYAHLHDQTLREAFDEYHDGKVVDIKGAVYEPTNRDVDSSNLQWFRSNIQAQALPNGSCSLPTVAQSCPHANACLTCTHFRTSHEHLDTHKAELEETEKILAKARANGWTRQIEMNEKIVINLRKIVDGLEAS